MEEKRDICQQPPEPAQVINEKLNIFAVHKDYELNTNFMPDDEYERLNNPMPKFTVVSGTQFDNENDFIDFVNEYSNAHTKIFYNDAKAVAIFNYSLPDIPERGDSRAVLPLVFTTEFSAFLLALQGQMSQRDFIRFLKKSEPFVQTPSGADLIEMAQSLQATTNVNSIQQNTNKQITVEGEIKSGMSQIQIPKHMYFEYPVYKCNRGITGVFKVELFIDSSGSSFVVDLESYDYEQVIEDVAKRLIDGMMANIEGVNAYRVVDTPK